MSGDGRARQAAGAVTDRRLRERERPSGREPQERHPVKTRDGRERSKPSRSWKTARAERTEQAKLGASDAAQHSRGCGAADGEWTLSTSSAGGVRNLMRGARVGRSFFGSGERRRPAFRSDSEGEMKYTRGVPRFPRKSRRSVIIRWRCKRPREKRQGRASRGATAKSRRRTNEPLPEVVQTLKYPSTPRERAHRGDPTSQDPWSRDSGEASR